MVALRDISHLETLQKQPHNAVLATTISQGQTVPASSKATWDPCVPPGSWGDLEPLKAAAVPLVMGDKAPRKRHKLPLWLHRQRGGDCPLGRVPEEHTGLIGGLCAANCWEGFVHPCVSPAPAPVTVVYVQRGGGAGWHSRGCPRCRDPHVFGEASCAANGPVLQLGAIKPDRCGAGRTGRETFPAQFDTDVGRAQELPRG